MKRLAILGILALTFAAGLATAAPQTNANQKNETRLAQMQQRFNLTPDQVSQLRTIFADEERQIETIRARYKGQKGSADRSALKTELQRVQQDTKVKMQAVVKPGKAGKAAKPNKRAQQNPAQRKRL